MRDRIIKAGDTIRYKPTGSTFVVKEVYAGTAMGEFELAGGRIEQARAILVLWGDSGHYPVGDKIEVLVPEGVDEESRYPAGGYCLIPMEDSETVVADRLLPNTTSIPDIDEWAERAEELERGLDAANQRTSKQHYTLEKRHYALAERMEKLDRELAEVECVKLPDLWLRSDELEREVADHETRITHQAADQVEYLGRLDVLELSNIGTNRTHRINIEDIANLVERVVELERLVGWYAGYPRRVDQEAGATASRPAWERDLEQHVDITGEPKDSTEKRKGD